MLLHVRNGDKRNTRSLLGLGVVKQAALCCQALQGCLHLMQLRCRPHLALLTVLYTTEAVYARSAVLLAVREAALCCQALWGHFSLVQLHRRFCLAAVRGQ